jgi:hypothetical protein
MGDDDKGVAGRTPSSSRSTRPPPRSQRARSTPGSWQRQISPLALSEAFLLRVNETDPVLDDARRPVIDRIHYAANVNWPTSATHDLEQEFQAWSRVATAARFVRWNASSLKVVSDAQSVLQRWGLESQGVGGRVRSKVRNALAVDGRDRVLEGAANHELAARVSQVCLVGENPAAFPYDPELDTWLASVAYECSFGGFNPKTKEQAAAKDRLDALQERSEADFRTALEALRSITNELLSNAHALRTGMYLAGIVSWSYDAKKLDRKLRNGKLPKEVRTYTALKAAEIRTRLVPAWYLANRMQWSIASDLGVGV